MAALPKETFDKFGYFPEDLPKNSGKPILAKCENCGETLENKKYRFTRQSNIRCKSCSLKVRQIDYKQRHKRRKETLLNKYGVENVSQLQDVKDKIAKTKQSKTKDEVDQSNKKREDTMLKKHGVKYILQDESRKSEIIDKAVRSRDYNSIGLKNKKNAHISSLKRQSTNLEKYGHPNPTFSQQHSKAEQDISDYLNSLGFNFKSDYSICKPKEIDLYDESASLAVEYCGLFWHTEDSPNPRDKWYHHNKWKTLRDKDIQLLTIFEDEWIDKCDIVKSILAAKLHTLPFLFARKLKCQEIDPVVCQQFMNENHLQGQARRGKYCWGLYADELVAAISINSHHRQEGLVLDRLAFKKGIAIHGGSSKLFKRCKTLGKIISWSDNRWSTGQVYKKLGFEGEELDPDYSYASRKKRLSKQSCMKSKIGCPDSLTEKEFMNSKGYSRIWDCGKIRWTWSPQ